MNQLQSLIAQAADKATADGIHRDNMEADEPSGRLANWIWNNCRFPEESFGYLIMLLAAELADRAAQAEGYANQADRAASLAFAKCGGPQ